MSYQSFKPLCGDCARGDATSLESQIKILLVEDNPGDALLARSALAQFFAGDFALTHVERLADAFNRMETEKFDVVLLDLTLPDSSGPDTFLKLRRHEPNLPVLVLTGLADEGAGIKAMHEGAQDYLVKNHLEPLVLARAVRYAIERQQVAAELRESEERLRIVTDTANVGLAAVDREHRYRYTNRAWAEFLELPTEDLAGQRMADRLGALYDEQIRHRLEMAFCGERVSHELVISPSSPGGEKRFFTASYELRANLLEPLVVVILVDVTEPRQAHEALLALHEVNTAITSTLDLQGVLDILLEKIERFLPIATATTVSQVNPATGAIEALACRGMDRDLWTLRQKSAPITNRARKVVDSGAPVMIRNIESASPAESLGHFRRYGLVSYLGVPLIAHNEIVGVLGLYTRQEHEFNRNEIDFINTLAGQGAVAIHNAQIFEQINTQARELEIANNVKDDFLGVMSHELRTPLNITLGYIGMMKDGLLGAITAEQGDALQKVLNHSADQLRMVEEILAATDLEARTIVVDRQRVDVSDILKQLQSDFDLIHDKNEAALVWDYPEEPVPMVTDGRKLRQVAQNLIGNALKFTDSGKITVSAKIISRTSERIAIPDEQTGEQAGRSQWLEIRVSGTGLGIPPDKLDVIFEKFHHWTLPRPGRTAALDWVSTSSSNSPNSSAA